VWFVASLLGIYEKVPDKFTAFLPKFVEIVKRGGVEAITVVQLFGEVAKRSPEVLLGRIACIAQHIGAYAAYFYARFYVSCSVRPYIGHNCSEPCKHG